MKRKFLYALLIIFLAGLLVLFESCKKEDYPEEDFKKQLKRGWFVMWFTFNDESSPVGISFLNISSLEYNNYTYYVSDPQLCQLPKIENIQYWTFTEYNNELHLQTEDLCGGVNNYVFSYNNYQSDNEELWGDVFVINADVTLIGQDTTISFSRFELHVNENGPSSSAFIDIEYEDGNPSFHLASID